MLTRRVELLNAIVALRRYHSEVLLKDLSANGQVKVASLELARHLDLVLNRLIAWWMIYDEPVGCMLG